MILFPFLTLLIAITAASAAAVARHNVRRSRRPSPSNRRSWTGIQIWSVRCPARFQTIRRVGGEKFGTKDEVRDSRGNKVIVCSCAEEICLLARVCVFARHEAQGPHHIESGQGGRKVDVGVLCCSGTSSKSASTEVHADCFSICSRSASVTGMNLCIARSHKSQIAYRESLIASCSRKKSKGYR